MNPDTILFILEVIEREMETADIDRQLYLMERREINHEKLLELWGK